MQPLEQEFKVLPWHPDLNPIEHLWDVLDQHVGSTSQPTGLEASAANSSVPDTTGHLQGRGVVESMP